jgi:hypothetical protein
VQSKVEEREYRSVDLVVVPVHFIGT